MCRWAFGVFYALKFAGLESPKDAPEQEKSGAEKLEVSTLEDVNVLSGSVEACQKKSKEREEV